jgi:rhodanese-related sulfurtransferase
VTHEVEDKPEYQRPYLILDLRTPHEFQACHILQGTSALTTFMLGDVSILYIRGRRGEAGWSGLRSGEGGG